MEYSQDELVQGMKNKDLTAYGEMISKYTKIIYYLAYNILSPELNKEDIEECVADVFIDAWYKIAEFDQEKGNFRTWLLVLTKYKALTYRRKKVNKSCVGVEEFDIRDSFDLEKQIILRQDQEKVIKTINSFNSPDKEIFFRRYFFNEKISDLARAFNLSRSAIDNRLFRGRNIIKGVLNCD